MKQIKRFRFEIIGVLCAIVCFVLGIYNMDFTPATSQDYKELEERAKIMEHNLDEIFKEEAIIHNESLEITLSNDECELTATFNEKLDLIDSVKKDKCKNKLYVFKWIIASIMIGWVAYAMCLGLKDRYKS